MSNLANCTIRFHTNDGDDKDWDTQLTVTVYDEDRRVAARISNNFGHFPNNSDNGPFTLTVLNASTAEKLQRGSIVIKIDPNGHDTWKFNFFLDLQLTDGSHLSGGAEGLVLTQDNRSQTFGLDGIVHKQEATRNISVNNTAAYTPLRGADRKAGININPTNSVTVEPALPLKARL